MNCASCEALVLGILIRQVRELIRNITERSNGDNVLRLYALFLQVVDLSFYLLNLIILNMASRLRCRLV